MGDQFRADKECFVSNKSKNTSMNTNSSTFQVERPLSNRPQHVSSGLAGPSGSTLWSNKPPGEIVETK